MKGGGGGKLAPMKHISQNSQETISGGVVLFAKIKKIYYLNGLFLLKFLKFFRAAFLTLSGDCFCGTKNLHEAAVRRSSLK